VETRTTSGRQGGFKGWHEVLFRICLWAGHGAIRPFARDLGVLVLPGELNKVIVAIVRVFTSFTPRWDTGRTENGSAKTPAGSLTHLNSIWPKLKKVLGLSLRRAPLDPAAIHILDSNCHTASWGLSAETKGLELYRRRRACGTNHAQANAARRLKSPTSMGPAKSG